MGFVERSLARARVTKPGAPCRDSALQEKYPAVAEFLTSEGTENGKPRKTATVTISFVQGAFKAFLNDRESRMSICVTADTIGGLWEALEGSITSDDPDWRPLPDWSNSGHQKAPKKKA